MLLNILGCTGQPTQTICWFRKVILFRNSDLEGYNVVMNEHLGPPNREIRNYKSKRHSQNLCHEEIQFKTTLRYHSILIRMLLILKRQNIKVLLVRMWRNYNSCFGDWNIKFYSQIWNTVRQFL